MDTDWKATVAEVAETLRACKNDGKAAVVLMGAGMSVTAKIPDANGFVKIIESEYPERVARKPRDYAHYMGALQSGQQRSLINRYLKNALINDEHLLLANLVREKYIDRILTVNFDSLMLKSLFICGLFPVVYDFAAANSFEHIRIASRENDLALFYLHGQGEGAIILNDEDSMTSLTRKLKEAKIFEDLNDRCWIVVGYSGRSDPVFGLLSRLDEYRRTLYWIGYNDEGPPSHVLEKLLKRTKSSKFVIAHDAESFLSDLTKALKINQPPIISNPFIVLREIISQIKTSSISISSQLMEVKWLIGLAEEFFQATYDDRLDNSSAYDTLYEAAKSIQNYAMQTDEKSKEFLFEAWYLFFRAAKFAPSRLEAHAGWGECLLELANRYETNEQQQFLQMAYRKFSQICEETKSAELFTRWGQIILKLVQMKQTDDEQVALLRDALDKFETARDIVKQQPDDSIEPEIMVGLGRTRLLIWLLTSGTNNELRIIKEDLEYADSLSTGIASYDLARVYALLGDFDMSIGHLIIALNNNYIPSINEILTDTCFKQLKQDERFNEFIQDYHKLTSESYPRS